MEHVFEPTTFAVRLGATLSFVLLNCFAVAAKLVPLKRFGRSRIETLANMRSGRARS